MSETGTRGLSFDLVAEDYERARPGWPSGVLDDVAGETVLDLAAGTGKLTRLLVERFPRVVAVEPGESMRAILTRQVPAAEALAGSAERIPLADASVDAVFVAEAFHWFDSARATAELARVLRVGGTCLVCFNIWRSSFKPKLPPSVRERIREAFARGGETGAPLIETGAWRAGFAGAPFAPFHETSIDHVFVCDRTAVVSYYLSLSNIAGGSPGEREALRRDLLAWVPDVPYRLELTADLWRTVRRAD